MASSAWSFPAAHLLSDLWTPKRSCLPSRETSHISILRWAEAFIDHWASLMAQMVKNLPAMQETQVWSLGWEDPREKGMASHSSVLVCRIPWQRSLAGYCPRGCKKSDMTERLILCFPFKVLPGNTRRVICIIKGDFKVILDTAISGKKGSLQKQFVFEMIVRFPKLSKGNSKKPRSFSVNWNLQYEANPTLHYTLIFLCYLSLELHNNLWGELVTDPLLQTRRPPGKGSNSHRVQ